ncbi:MAG: glycosyltransferase, partial [Alicyclobacillus sp.]|nr:glycosyltransferase [Alicyclobacillus sp.]
LQVCVVNDGGASVAAVCRQADRRLSVRWLDLPQAVGQVAARNRALAMAEAEWLAVCDDDDRWLPDHAVALAEALAKRPDCPLAYTDAELVQLQPAAQGGWQPLARRVFAWRDAQALLRRYNPLVPASWLYRRAVHAHVGGFDEAMSHYWDWDFLLRIQALGDWVRIPACLTLYGVYTDGANQSARPAQMAPALAQLVQKHRLAALPPSNFWRMCEDPALVAERSPSQRVWDGHPGVWGEA